MNRIGLLYTTLLCLALTSGCVDLSGLIDIKTNGTGTITLKIFDPQKNPAAIQAKKNRLKNANFLDKLVGGIKDGTENQIASIYNPGEEQNLKQLAGVFGPGVRLLRSQNIQREDGTPGVLATFSFADVNHLRIGPQELGPGAEPGPPPWAYRFKLTQDATKNRLRIYPPSERELQNSLSIKDSIVGVDQIPGFEGLVRRLMEYSRIKFVIRAGDQIVASNAIYAVPGRADSIILTDLEMKKVMSELGYNRMLEISNPSDLKAISGGRTKGLLIEDPDKVIVVDFK